MTIYAIRIELEGRPSGQTYDDLHKILAEGKVFRAIQCSDSKYYMVPEATYVYYNTADLDTLNIFNWLVPKVRTTGHRFKMFVVKITQWSVGPDGWIE